MVNNLVINSNGIATTTSLKVASAFNKRHDDLLKKIKKLNKGFGGLGKIAESYFTASTYLNEQNKEQPCYNISRDGFVLLTMGFTGKKALEFKLKYIEAFNLMEAKLKELSSKPDFTTTLTTVKQHTRKIPTQRVRKEIVLSETSYEELVKRIEERLIARKVLSTLGGVVNRCMDSRIDRIEKLLTQAKFDFNQMDLPEAQKANLTIFKDLNKMIAEYGRACEIIGNMQGIVALKKMLPERLYNEVSKCISQKSI